MDNNDQQTNILEPVINTLKKLPERLTADGWKKYSMGNTRRIDYDYRFDLYIRRRELKSVLQMRTGDPSEMSPDNAVKEVPETKDAALVSNTPAGRGYPDLTPEDPLAAISCFNDYPSLAAVRSDTFSLVIAYDAEWFSVKRNGQEARELLSWQFAVIHHDELVEYIFFRKHPKFNLPIEIALGRILDSLDYPAIDTRKIPLKYKSRVLSPDNELTTVEFSTFEEADSKSSAPFEDGRKVQSFYDWHDVKHLSVTLLCHSGKGDISAFDQSGVKSVNLLKHCNDVQGGLISLQPFFIHPGSLDPIFNKNGHSHKYPLLLSIADTMCHAPANKKKLKDLGETIGYSKISLRDGDISHMDQLLQNDPVKYMEYASTDSVVTLLYAASIYGVNKEVPATITGAAARIMRETMKKYLNCTGYDEFEKKYRGVHIVRHGKIKNKQKDKGPEYLSVTSKEPISRDAEIIQMDAGHAYHGGYNSCSDVGFFPFVTTDYDLKNAYPTAMTLVPDVDWQKPIKYHMTPGPLTIQDFAVGLGSVNPVPMMFAYVSFRFPETVKYPCIPISDDGSLIYPRASDGLDGVYACGPELYLAVQLGAEVTVIDGYVLNSIYVDGKESFSLREAVRQLVVDRNKAKKDRGSGSLEEQILKTIVNAGYGKVAQNVIQKQKWSAYFEEMETLGCSSITNPVAAAMITSIVRAELIAAQNQCHELGYMTFSVTTDGFISDVPEEVLRSLDLFGLRRFMEQSRLFLTDGRDCEIWVAKHKQDDLVNFTTRGNVSLYCLDKPFLYDGKEYAGVCAHNSTKSGWPKDSYEDRFWLMTEVLKRTGPVIWTSEEWPPFKKLALGDDFLPYNMTRKTFMDFDMKRKPDRDSFFTRYPVIDGNAYEIACFTTAPFENLAEYRFYRLKKKLVNVLRTEKDWADFFTKIDTGACNVKVRDLDWAILNSCIMGHRSNRWTIPKLDELTGQERNAWINSHNASSKIFTDNDWKNAGRSSRHAGILPRELLEDKLNELICDIDLLNLSL